MMHTLETTPRGFTYMPVTYQDCLSWGGFGVCDSCNQNMQYGYLVFVLNSCICSRCLNEWIERSSHYPQEDVDYDLNYQQQHQTEWYKWHTDRM